MVERFDLDFHGCHGQDAFIGPDGEGGYVSYADYARLEEVIIKLRNELGSARHDAAVATIGHEQLNRHIKIYDNLGFRGHHIDDQIRMAAEELRYLREKG